MDNCIRTTKRYPAHHRFAVSVLAFINRSSLGIRTATSVSAANCAENPPSMPLFSHSFWHVQSTTALFLEQDKA